MKRICPYTDVLPQARTTPPPPSAQQKMPIVVERVELPEDLVRCIMAYLDPCSLSALSRVAKAWFEASQEVVLAPRPSLELLAPFGGLYYPNCIRLDQIQKCFKTSAGMKKRTDDESYFRLGLIPAGRRFPTIEGEDKKFNRQLADRDCLSTLLSVAGWQSLRVGITDPMRINRFLKAWAQEQNHIRTLDLMFVEQSEGTFKPESIDLNLENLKIRTVSFLYPADILTLKGTLHNIQIFGLTVSCLSSASGMQLFSQKLPLGAELCIDTVEEFFPQLLHARQDINTLSISNRVANHFTNEQNLAGVFPSQIQNLHLDFLYLYSQNLKDIFGGQPPQSLQRLRLSDITLSDFAAFTKLLKDLPNLNQLEIINLDPVVVDDEHETIAKLVGWETSIHKIVHEKQLTLRIS